MTYKKKVISLLFVAVISFAIGYSLMELISFEFSTCGNGYIQDNSTKSDKIKLTPSCTGFKGLVSSINENLGFPLVVFSMTSFIFLIFFLVTNKEEVFKTWSKFSIMFLTVAVLYIAFMPDYRDAFFTFDEEFRTFFLALVFTITSILIITIKSFKLRKDGK